MKLQTSGIDSMSLRNQTVQRLSVNCIVVTSSGLPSTVNFDKVAIRLVLKREGQTITIFDTKLGILAKDSMYAQGYEIANGGGYTTVNTLTYLFPLVIDLGSPINVVNQDELILQVDAAADWFGTASVVGASCYIDFDWREMIGVEEFTPIIEVETIVGGKAEHIASLGDNVTSVALISNSSNALTDALKVFDNLTLDSDRYRINDNFHKMLGRRQTQFDFVTVANTRWHSFKYVPETEIDDVQLRITLIPANNAVSTNHVVTRKLRINQTTQMRADAFKAKHEIRDAQKVRKQLNRVTV